MGPDSVGVAGVAGVWWIPNAEGGGPTTSGVAAALLVTVTVAGAAVSTCGAPTGIAAVAKTGCGCGSGSCGATWATGKPKWPYCGSTPWGRPAGSMYWLADGGKNGWVVDDVDGTT